MNTCNDYLRVCLKILNMPLRHSERIKQALRDSGFWRYGIIWLAYLGIAIIVTLPLAIRLTTHLPEGTDTLLHYWNCWWVRQALQSGQSPYYTPYLSYPDGLSMVYHNFPWLHIAIWLVLRPLIGGIAAYNLTFLIHLSICGFALFTLAYEVTGDRRAAFLAGLIYQCWPYRLSQPSHPNLMSTWGIPIFLLFLGRTLRRGQWQNGLLAGLSLALVGYSRWQLLIPTTFIGGLYLVLTLPGSWDRRPIRPLLLAGVVVIIALTPPALLLLREWHTNPADLIIETEEVIMQTDVLAYLTPPGSHPVFGTFTQPAYERYYPDRGSRSSFSPYLGVTTLLLVLLGMWKTHRRDTLPWAAIALVLILLALGPSLRINGQLYSVAPMPYNLAARLFVVRLLRAPERFNMFLSMPLSMLAAYGTTHILRLLGSPKVPTSPKNCLPPYMSSIARACRCSRYKRLRVSMLFCLLGSAIFFEYFIAPLPLQSAQVSEFYSQLAAEPGQFAVLNIPVNVYNSKPYMFAQTTHHRPILQGHSSRYPQGAFHYLESQPWLRAMQQFDELPPKQMDISRQLAALANDKIRYLIIHKSTIGSERWTKWERYFAIVPRFEDEAIAVYTTAPQARQDFRLAPEIIPGLGIIRTVTSTTCVNPGGLVEVDVAWGTTAPPKRDFGVRLALESEADTETYAEVFPMSLEWPIHKWPANAVIWGYYTVHIPPTLPVGKYAITLALADPETETIQGQPSIVGWINIQSTPCAFATPPDAARVNALFGDVMRLLSYRMRQHEDTLTLTLQWHSERRMDTNYKVFVHIFDPATGIPVAQYDAMPLQWRYPTTFWGPGETVMDTISIPLKEAPPGLYGLAVGIYNPKDMERLPVADEAGQLQAEGRLVLRGETVKIKVP